jgi:HEPN domain-containing protein
VAELDAPEFSRWQEQAMRTLDTARLAADGDRPEWACFLAEQAAQLAVKGLLHGLGEPAWGHDLTVLVALAKQTLGEAWSRDVDDKAARLARHYIPARYPDAHPSGPPGSHYRPADAAQALADCRAILAAVGASWNAVTETGS